MAITRKNTMIQQQSTPLPPPSPPTPPQTTTTTTTTTTTAATSASDYEQTREQRIKENRERLMKLGIPDLSNQLKSVSSTPRQTRKYDRKTPLKTPALVSEPRRRSSRLQNAPPVTYVETKEDKSQRSRDIVLEEGAKPEFYTEEHEKLLGSTEMPWTFFVDGYAADGTRIYDSVKGKTCHQCRQKTLGQRTHCCKCNLVQGQFCGDCLYMRYGEHVVEANQNPNWICPPCRGICNCSLCRQAKGWAPTGALYKRINKLGYKSVAHYLIQTQRAPPADSVSDAQQSAKRSLPFEGMEVPAEGCSDDLTADSKTEITMKSEDNVTPDTESTQKPKGVRRSARKSAKESADEGEETAMNADVAADSKTEITMKSEDKVTPDTESTQKPKGVRRSARKSTKETADVGKETAVNADVAEETAEIVDVSEDAPVADIDLDSGEETMTENRPVSDDTSLEAAERPTKRPKMENMDAGVTVNRPIMEVTSVC